MLAQRSTRMMIYLGMAILAVSCDTAPTGLGESDSSDIAVEVSPAWLALERGMKYQLTVAVREGSSRRQASGRLAWQSRDPNIATISPGGTVTAVGLGSTSIVATWHGRQASAGIIVVESSECGGRRDPEFLAALAAIPGCSR